MRAALPMPFIVGAPRSGTTLLRLMLDAHPDVAIPPETGIFPWVAAAGEVGPDASRAEFLRRIVGMSTWVDFHIDPDAFVADVLALETFTIAEGIRCFYRSYAARFGKRRWGDKTPAHGAEMRAIERVLPEARFLHIIRDGRDVGVSVRWLPFSPGSDVPTLAADWRGRVSTIRALGRGVRHYREVHYERLLAEPPAVLEEISAFLDLDFDASMLRYFERAADRLAEHEGRSGADGGPTITAERRRLQQRMTTLPPDLTRIGRWKEELSRDETRVFEGIAGDLLDELGYLRASGSAS
jgi:hypothetical protein